MVVLSKRWPDDNWRVVNARGDFGACLAKTGRIKQAKPLLVKSYRTFIRTLGREARCTIKAANRLVSFYDLIGQHEKAAAYRDRLEFTPPVSNSSPRNTTQTTQ